MHFSVYLESMLKDTEVNSSFSISGNLLAGYDLLLQSLQRNISITITMLKRTETSQNQPETGCCAINRSFFEELSQARSVSVRKSLFVGLRSVTMILMNLYLFAAAASVADTSYMPAPFTRRLELQTPYMSGKDVIILQNLLRRLPEAEIKVTTVYDEQTALAVREYQKRNDMAETGAVCRATAKMVLKNLMSDGFKDDKKVPAGYKFKLYVPVHKNRDIETTATLFDAKDNAVYKFTIRARGGTDHANNQPINQFTTNGNTPSGLSTCDLNSKEPDPRRFGPYPVLRAVKGLEGNSAIGYDNKTLLSNFRSGILLHTGQWNGWDKSKPMPNSLGCMHCSPDDLKNIVHILVTKLGVKVRENPYGKLPYPYEPQGLIAIEQID